MRQLSLKLKSYGGAISIVDNNNLERRVFYILVSFFGALGFLYVVILGNMTFDIIERKSSEAEARTLANEVLQLELTYLDISSKVDMALAESMGFKEAKTNFATRKSIGSVKIVNNDL